MLGMTDVWPLFGLELCTPRLLLTPLRDEHLPGLIDAALAGIHDPEVMPFGVPWTDAPRDVLIRETAKFHWRLRSATTADNWRVSFVVLLDGVPIGIQELAATDFALTRTVSSGSWLTQSQQGVGLGREMRAAVLLFAFDHLGATAAETSAASFNAASLGVSHGLGYIDDGTERQVTRPGEVADIQRLRLPAGAFIRPEWMLGVTGLNDAVRSDRRPRRNLGLSVSPP